MGDSALKQWLLRAPLTELTEAAAKARDAVHGRLISYSRKVFIPLTKLCRDVCHYCTFAETPRLGRAPISRRMRCWRSPAPARRGMHGGAVHAGRQAGAALRRCAGRAGRAGLRDDDRLPARDVRARVAGNGAAAARQSRHDDARRDRGAAGVSVSQGIMLESPSSGCARRAGPLRGARQAPSVRLDMIAAGGRLHVPFTSGILIGIGETRPERIESLLALRDLHRAATAIIQEIIVQNFRAKPGTKMARRAGAGSRRIAVDRRRRAPDPRAGDEHPGPAEPQPGGYQS